jgi:hypothetical protein
VSRLECSGSLVHVAYQVFGSGPIDLVLAPGFVSQIENYWDQPDLARWLRRLSFMFFYFCVLSLEYPQALSSSI